MGGIWVRTADGYGLVLIREFWVVEDKVDGAPVFHVLGDLNQSESVILGKYNTLEAALALLDDIQKWLKAGTPRGYNLDMNGIEWVNGVNVYDLRKLKTKEG